MSSAPSRNGLMLIFMLIFIMLALFIWIFILEESLNTRKLTETQSPHCLEFSCVDSTTKVNYKLNPSADPNVAKYETMNYCSINGPPTSFVQGLQVCAGTLSSSDSDNISPPSESEVTKFAKFYDEDYVDTCGWNWKNPSPIKTGSDTPQEDPVITALVGCAKKLGISDNKNITSLSQKCPMC